MNKLLTTILLLCLPVASFAGSNADASFDSGSGILTIPTLNVGKQTFYVELTLNNSEALDFVLSASSIQSKISDPRAATFTAENNILSIPIVDTDSDAYKINFLLTKDTPVTFRLIQANLVNINCMIPTLPQFSTVASPMTYKQEVFTNTKTRDDFGLVKTIVSDFNGDNKDDIFWMATAFNEDASDDSHNNRMWLSNGNNSFTDSFSDYFPNGLNSDTPRQIFKADFNNDARMDFLILQHGYDPGGINNKDCSNVNCPGAANILMMTDADGKLRDEAQAVLNPFDTKGFTHSGGAADIDCDGDIDILEGQLPNPLATATNHVQVNDGRGTFTEKMDALPAEIDSFGMYGAALCDFDRDGDPDLYISSLGVPKGLDSADKLLVNNGFGVFTLRQGRPAPESAIGDANQRAADLQCLDYDNDGYNDIIKPNEADSNFPAFELLRNNGDLTFTDVTNSKLRQSPLVGGAFRPKLVDLNADGWIDILAQGNGDYMRIYWNTGNGFDEFKFPSETAYSTKGAVLSAGDFDGDGDLDIHISRSHFQSFLLNASF
ncbi:VCBS repeat-containing protein [Gammaproteobacteria bacterium]|nr:VCBS repeat-containing protein [Gammaproteobacteria bacterium]